MKRNFQYSVLTILCGFLILTIPKQSIASKADWKTASSASLLLTLAEDLLLKRIPQQKDAEQKEIDPLLNRLAMITEKAVPIAKRQVYRDTLLGSMYVRSELQRIKQLLIQVKNQATPSVQDAVRNFEKFKTCLQILIKMHDDKSDTSSILFYFSEYPKIEQKFQELFQMTPQKADDVIFWITRPGNPDKVISFIDRSEKSIEQVSTFLTPIFVAEWQKEKGVVTGKLQEAEKQLPNIVKATQDANARYHELLKKEGSTSQSASVKNSYQVLEAATILKVRTESQIKDWKERLIQIEKDSKALQGQVPAWCDVEIAKIKNKKH